MPVREYLSNASIANIRAPNAQTGRAQQYETFAGVFDHMAKRADKFASRHLKEENQKAAMKAVDEGNFKPVEARGREFAQFYNEVGIAAEAARLEVEISGAVSAAEAQNPMDTEGFLSAADALKKPLLEGLDPRLRTAASLKFKSLRDAGRIRISNAILKREREQKGAVISFGAAQLAEDAKRFAYAGNIGAAAALFKQANDARAGLIAYGYKPEALMKLSEASLQEIEMEELKGKFDRTLALDARAAASMIGKVRVAGMDPKNKELSTENRGKVVRWMEGRLRDVNREVDRQQDLWDKYVKEKQEENLARLVPNAMQGLVNLDALDSMLARREISSSGYIQLHKINENGLDAEDNEDEINRIRLGMFRGQGEEWVMQEVAKLAERGQIRSGTFSSVLNEMNTDKFGVTKRDDYKMAAAEIRLIVHPEGPTAPYATGQAYTEVLALRRLQDELSEGKKSARQIVDDMIPFLKDRGRSSRPKKKPSWLIETADGQVDVDKNKEYLEGKLDDKKLDEKAFKQRYNEMMYWHDQSRPKYPIIRN